MNREFQATKFVFCCTGNFAQRSEHKNTEKLLCLIFHSVTFVLHALTLLTLMQLVPIYAESIWPYDFRSVNEPLAV